MPGVTRLAPSPTGALHLGNARTFLINWLLARQNDWTIVLRIEDLDGPRIKPGAGEEALDDLMWLGLDWDDGPIYQSTRGAEYQRAIDSLLAGGQAYYCACTRKEVALAASAPHADDGATVYPGTCRGKYSTRQEATQAAGREPAVRFAVGDAPVNFVDAFTGPQSFDPPRQLGDFVIQKSDGTAAYQLAVVVDDAAAGVSHVVRGDDLIDSTPRQIMLYRALGLAGAIPQYTHLPLIIGTDGKRLAKRHGDSRLAMYRSLGVPAARLRALLAKWCGADGGDTVSIEHLLTHFSLDRIPPTPLAFTRHDDAFLRGSCS